MLRVSEFQSSFNENDYIGNVICVTLASALKIGLSSMYAGATHKPAIPGQWLFQACLLSSAGKTQGLSA